ncbi:hypothetical protein [Actinoplanes sp. URMC 104]|uniref:hypothetical protein n=1 Tax=Actinoplanes sp. URMC 104 TaxID=3423409 RepID=UPI003F194BBB
MRGGSIVLSGLWRHITDNLGSYLGTLAVTVLVTTVSWPFRRLRESARRPVTVYLGSTWDELAEHRAAIRERLSRDPVVLVERSDIEPPEQQIRDATMFVGLYAWQYGASNGESDSHRELVSALDHHSGPRLRLWMVRKGQRGWSLGHEDTNYRDDDSPIGRLRRLVLQHNPQQLPNEPAELAREVATAVREVRRLEHRQSRYLDSLLDPRSFAVGAAVAVAASLYFAVRISVVGAASSFATVLLLSLACGAIAYLARVASTVSFLR